MKYTNFWTAACVPSTILKVLCVANKAFIGRTINIPTIIIGNIEMEFPAMYIINRFIGTCFKGPRATSQSFLMSNKLESVSFEDSV